MPARNRSPFFRLACAALGAALAASGSLAAAAGFAVSPIRLEFERNVRTGSVTVTNDSTQPLDLQVRAFEWTQDAAGQDVYTESQDLIVFPGAVQMAGEARQLIRVGIRQPAVDRERTYRVFIEELPRPPPPGQPRAQVAIRVRFGLPVFVKPLEGKPAAEIASARVENGRLRVDVRNTGNVHAYAETVTVEAGGASYSAERGWYVLAGATRGFPVALPPTACKPGAPLKVAARGQGIDAAREVTLSAADCAALAAPTR
jgi:fimbrial chaperone protein